ncbi:DUF6544 family protein [Mucilaginibacter gilvus]|uniref:DUF6544 family protein n=1 Tax=Mucilaginibacter gilvus TaxID=2305909 RepID=UPI001FB9AB50|nr:DUF6544 family protein [Mucilaginibacter gilvus]
MTGFLAFVFAAKTRASIQFHKQVKRLFSLSETSGNVFQYSQLEGLPAPVQRYFKHVLTDGQPYINYVRLKHSGKFKTGPGKKWINIVGEEYFTTAIPGFLWKCETTTFTAKDFYINGSGGLNVSLFSIYPIVNGRGRNFDQGELLRWLAESVWFPTNLLPSENLRWEDIDSKTAKLIFQYQGLQVYYIVSFNEADEIIQLETRRYMGDTGLETWLAKLSDYHRINGVSIPYATEAIWQLKEGALSYARFQLTNIQYNNPKAFNN